MVISVCEIFVSRLCEVSKEDNMIIYESNNNNDYNPQINRDYYQSVFGYRQYHVLGIKIVLCEPLVSIIHYFLFPIHDTADTQRHEGNNLFII